VKLCYSYRRAKIKGVRTQNAMEDILTQEVRKLHDEEHIPYDLKTVFLG
jgi:hypothetical protein